MSKRSGCSVYVGNLDEKVNDRVLYEVMVQAGRVVDLHIPRDRETNRPKGYAFIEYETEEIAEYAVRLFSGVVFLNNRMLKFAMSKHDKPSHDSIALATPTSNSPTKPRSEKSLEKHGENSQQEARLMTCRFSKYSQSFSANHPEGHERRKYRSNPNNDYAYSKRVYRATMDNI